MFATHIYITQAVIGNAPYKTNNLVVDLIIHNHAFLSLSVKNDIFFRFCIDIQLIMDIQLIYQPTTSHA